MTDEEKKTCNCSEIGRFFTLVAAIFLGVLLAILVSAAILKPQCPCHKGIMPMGRPRIERHMPPPMKMHLKNRHKYYIDAQKLDKHFKDFEQFSEEVDTTETKK